MFQELLDHIHAGNVLGVQYVLSGSNDEVSEIINRIDENFKGSSEREYNPTPLLQAILSTHANSYECVEVLLKAGANHYICGCNSSVQCAVLVQKPRILKLLLEHGASVDPLNYFEGDLTLFHVACANNYVECARILLDYGARIDDLVLQRPQHMQRTALMYASWKGNVEMVKFLLENGADPNVTNRDGKTAFDMVCTYDDVPRIWDVSGSRVSSFKPEIKQQIEEMLKEASSFTPLLK